jgi:hypothetical protein
MRRQFLLPLPVRLADHRPRPSRWQPTDCNFHIIGPWSNQTPCDRAKDFLGRAGLSFTSVPAMPEEVEVVVTRIGTLELKGLGHILRAVAA